jgi:outer membrane protein assembly factor BamE
MQMLLPTTARIPALVGALCVVLATGLLGCASKNPLMELPVAANSGATKPSAEPSNTAETKTASAAAASADVQTSTPSRTQRFLGIFSPHRIDIQQGNFVSLEMMSQLKEGMKRKEGVTREQVRFALGTPLLTDLFHADRWDYVFRLKKSNGNLITSHIALFFKDNRLVRFDGSVLPTEKEYLALIAGAAPAPTAAPQAAPDVKPATQ